MTFLLLFLPLEKLTSRNAPLPTPQGNHSIAICQTGSLIGFGNNNACQLGTGSSSADEDPPVAVLNMTNAVAVSTGGEHSLALKEDGSVWVWGNNNLGQSANSNIITDVCTPSEVSDLGCAVAVSAGGEFSLALMADGTIYTWGSNANGQLGTGSTSPAYSTSPVQVTGVTTAVSISAGYSHAMALLADGTVKVWGAGYDGQIGNNTTWACNKKVDSELSLMRLYFGFVKRFDIQWVSCSSKLSVCDGYYTKLQCIQKQTVRPA